MPQSSAKVGRATPRNDSVHPKAELPRLLSYCRLPLGSVEVKAYIKSYLVLVFWGDESGSYAHIILCIKGQLHFCKNSFFFHHHDLFKVKGDSFRVLVHLIICKLLPGFGFVSVAKQVNSSVCSFLTQ